MFTQDQNIGKKIKELRKEKGLTLADITNLTGLSKTTISDIENNKTKPNYATLEKLAKIIDLKTAIFEKQFELDKLAYDSYKNNLNNKTKDPIEGIIEDFLNPKNEINKEHKESIDSFTIKLVEELLNENIIKDPENIPQEIVDLILVKLKKDVEMRKRSEK